MYFAIPMIVTVALFLEAERRKKWVMAVLMKGLSSLLFVLVGVMGYLATPDPWFARLVLIGLICGMVGDILLNLRYLSAQYGQKIFILGILIFLAGHVMYLIALCSYSENVWIAAVLGIIATAVILKLLFSVITDEKKMKVFGVFYIGAVVLMTAVAIGNLIAVQKIGRLLFSVGAILFTLSDIVMIANTFQKSEIRHSMRVTNIVMYYVGQILLAASLFLEY